MEPLLANLDALLETSFRDLGSPPSLVVPSPSLARWLKLRLCERRGPVLGLETTTLEAHLWKVLGPEQNDQLLHVPVLQQAVLAVLTPQLLQAPLYGTVRRFLSPKGEPDPRRRVQFAHEISRLFLEYEYNRPSVWAGSWVVKGLDQTWPGANLFHPDTSDETEAWQRDLHARVFASEGPFGQPGLVRWLGLPRLHRLRRETGWQPPPGELILFGLDKVSHFHRNLLLELSQVQDLHVFLLNPCAEFWEDLDTSCRPRSTAAPRRGPTPLRLRRDSQRDDWLSDSLPERCHPEADQDPYLLRSWGRTARENIVLWCQAAEWDFESLEPETDGSPSFLATVQEALRRRHPGPLHEALERDDGSRLEGDQHADGTLLLLEAPDRGREMETLRDQILSWLEQDPRRTPGDVVVYLPDPTRHRVQIERVFGALAPGDPGHLPYTLLGVSSRESQWTQGVLAFLRLVRGPLDRPSLFALLRNDLCRARLGLESATLRRWEHWCEGTGMIRGWDLADRSTDRHATPSHCLRTGLERLLLAPLSGASGVQLPGRSVPLSPWRDFASSDADQLERFCATLERIHVDTTSLRALSGTVDGPTLAGELITRLDRWLDTDSAPAEAGVRRSLLEGLDPLSLRAGEAITLEELEELVQSLAESELPGSSRAWTGVVTFAPLRTGHILPHGLVLIPGLDADAFPAEATATTLDLLGKHRIVGDPDPASDGRHAFLLALLSARDRLVLSWRSRDIQKDEAKDPSTVVLELEEAMRQGFTERSLRRSIRLLAREAPRQSQELPDPFWETLPSAPVPKAPSPPVMVEASSARLDTRRIARFLRDSWSHRIEADLDAIEDELPDTLGATDEALEASALARAILRRNVFPALLHLLWNGDKAGAEALAADAHARSAWDADAPEGPQLEREASELAQWVGLLQEWVGQWRSQWPEHRVETGVDLSLRSAAPTSLSLHVPGHPEVSLEARFQAVLVGPRPHDPVVVLAATTPPSRKDWPFHKRIEPLLGTLFLQMAGHAHVQAVLVPTRPGTPCLLDAIPQTCATEWLPWVVSDLLSGGHEYLPASPIVDLKRRDLVSLRESLEEGGRSDLERMLDPLLPGESDGDEDRFQDLVLRRLGPFLGDAGEEIEP